jgi:hypothetical protein
MKQQELTLLEIPVEELRVGDIIHYTYKRSGEDTKLKVVERFDKENFSLEKPDGFVFESRNRSFTPMILIERPVREEKAKSKRAKIDMVELLTAISPQWDILNDKIKEIADRHGKSLASVLSAVKSAAKKKNINLKRKKKEYREVDADGKPREKKVMSPEHKAKLLNALKKYREENPRPVKEAKKKKVRKEKVVIDKEALRECISENNTNKKKIQAIANRMSVPFSRVYQEVLALAKEEGIKLQRGRKKK